MTINDKLNKSGYHDPTAYMAIEKVSKEEEELYLKVLELVKVFRNIANFAGFELVGRIHLKHRKTGREFR
jgi:hypothetical protein